MFFKDYKLNKAFDLRSFINTKKAAFVKTEQKNQSSNEMKGLNRRTVLNNISEISNLSGKPFLK